MKYNTKKTNRFRKRKTRKQRGGALTHDIIELLHSNFNLVPPAASPTLQEVLTIMTENELSRDVLPEIIQYIRSQTGNLSRGYSPLSYNDVNPILPHTASSRSSLISFADNSSSRPRAHSSDDEEEAVQLHSAKAILIKSYLTKLGQPLLGENFDSFKTLTPETIEKAKQNIEDLEGVIRSIYLKDKADILTAVLREYEFRGFSLEEIYDLIDRYKHSRKSIRTIIR